MNKYVNEGSPSASPLDYPQNARRVPEKETQDFKLGMFRSDLEN